MPGLYFTSETPKTDKIEVTPWSLGKLIPPQVSMGASWGVMAMRKLKTSAKLGSGQFSSELEGHGNSSRDA